MPGKPALVYIAGCGHSGSTLLDVMLQAHTGMFSIGEAVFLEHWLEHDLLCTCGVEISRCSFWSSVLGETGIRNGTAIVKHTDKYHERINQPEFNLRLFMGILKESGAQILIDSSKTPRRLKMLYASGLFDLHVIHLVRDGRSFLNSKLQPGKHTRVRTINAKRHTPRQIIIRWVMVNLYIEYFLKRHNLSKWIRIRYEDLVTDPKYQLTKICELCGINFQPDMAHPSLKQSHNIGGSGWRFKSHDHVELILDEKWRSTLPRRQVMQFQSLAGWLNFRYGYRK